MNDLYNYFIKDGYACNLDKTGNPIPYINDEYSGMIFQVQVYEYARKIIKLNGLQSILDVGCGFGAKLEKIIYPVCQDIVGVDVEHAISYCKEKYQFGDWVIDDIEFPQKKLDNQFDMIISSDVIEHLVNPDKLLEYIRHYCHAHTHIIISTPERDRISNQNPLGPPRNQTHVREWNMSELHSYFRSRGFSITNHILVGEKPTSYWAQIKKIIRNKALRKIQVVLCHRE